MVRWNWREYKLNRSRHEYGLCCQQSVKQTTNQSISQSTQYYVLAHTNTQITHASSINQSINQPNIMCMHTHITTQSINQPNIMCLHTQINTRITHTPTINQSSNQPNIMWTRRGGRMSRAPASRAGRSWNPKMAGSNLDPVDSISGRVIPMTLKLILVTS